MEKIQQQSCLSKMIDVRGMIVAARRAMVGADNSTALAMMAVFLLVLFVLVPIWITFDLHSTWAFTTSIRDSASPIIDYARSDAQNLMGLTVGGALIGLVLTSFTLLPSLFEIAFPTVNHPLVNAVLSASILFDYVTDWPRAWEVTSQWSSNPPVHFAYCVFFNLFMSVGVQALIVISLTVMVFGAITIIRGPMKQTAQPVIVDQG